MLYDARGKPLGPVRETVEATVTGIPIRYTVLPAKEMDGEVPYASSVTEYLVGPNPRTGRREVVLTKEEAQISRTTPAELRPVFALHEHLHGQDLTHREMFPYELAAARELGVGEAYLRFFATQSAFDALRCGGRTGPETLANPETERGRSAVLERTGAEQWVRREPNAMLPEGYRTVPLEFPLRPAQPLVILP